MTINDYITLVGSNPFTNADFIANGYAPINDATFQATLRDYISFNHGDLEIRYRLEDSTLENIVFNSITCYFCVVYLFAFL